MQRRFETFYRGLLLVLALMLGWSFWASGQVTEPAAATAAVTNGAAGGATTNSVVATNAPALPVHLLPSIDRQFLTFGLDRFPLLRDHRVMGIPLWQYGASFLFIFLAFYVAKSLDYLCRVWLKRWTDRTESKADDLLLEVANGPVKIVAFVVLLHLGLSVFEWPPAAERWISNGLKVVVAVSITYGALKLVDVALMAWKGKRAADPALDHQLIGVINRALKALVIVVATLVTLDNVGVNITGLVASLSIGGLALGLAAQDTVANLFGAVSVLIDKPFKTGDRIQFDGVDGVVETIGLRSTRVRSLDGFLITVPNKTMGNATITNVASRPRIRTMMNIGLTYDTPAERMAMATRLLEDILRAHPKTDDVLIGFNKFADFSLNILVIHWWADTDYKAYLRGMQEMHLEIKRRFDAEKLSFAFPSQTVYLKHEAESASPSPSAGGVQPGVASGMGPA